MIESTPSSPDVTKVLVENHKRFLAFLERRVRSRDVAEDILQDAFVRGIMRGGQIRDGESAIAWFYRVLRNAVTDHYRRQSAEQRAYEAAGAEMEDTVAPVDPELWDEACACVRSLVDTLKPEYAAAIRRVDLDGVPVKAFAEEQGISPNNAAVRLHRAHDALKKQVTLSCGLCAEHGCYNCQCKRHHASGGDEPSGPSLRV